MPLKTFFLVHFILPPFLPFNFSLPLPFPPIQLHEWQHPNGSILKLHIVNRCPKGYWEPTGSLLLLSPSLLALSPKHQTGIYIHGFSSFMVYHISIVKYGTNLSIGVLSSFYAQHRLHQPSAELHSPSNKVYCESVKLNPVVQKMPDLTCMVMVLSYHILFCHVLLRGFHHLHIQITPK